MAPFRRAGLTSQPSDSEVEHIIPSIVGGGTGGEQAQAQMGGLALEGANMAAAAGSTILMDEEGGAMGVNSSIHASDRKSMSIKSKKVERKSAATRSADDEGEGDDNDDSSSNNERTSLLGRQPKQVSRRHSPLCIFPIPCSLPHAWLVQCMDGGLVTLIFDDLGI